MTDIEILQEEAERGVRLRADQILDIWLEKAGGRTLGVSAAPQDGWLMHTYMYLRNQLFPHIPGPSDEETFRTGRNSLLDFMRHAYEYERMHCSFDPKRDFCLLSGQEITENGFIPEYLRMKELIREMHVYEFMRIGADITPFNTVGHIGGVHYVAMYVAKQLYASGVPVDLGLVSAAAASHDIGKYGCREHEERRVPYLHYYYTDYCLRRLGLGQIKRHLQLFQLHQYFLRRSAHLHEPEVPGGPDLGEDAPLRLALPLRALPRGGGHDPA